MNKIAYKISSAAYFLIFVILLSFQFKTEPGEAFIGLGLLSLIILPSIILGIFGFTKIEITPSSKGHIYMTWIATGIILLTMIWAALSGECVGEGGMGCAIILILAVIFFGIAQLVGLTSLIELGIMYLKGYFSQKDSEDIK